VRNLGRNSIFFLSLTLPANEPADAATDLDASWSDGIRLSSADGSTTIKFGGQIQSDWVFQEGEDELLAVLGDGGTPASLEDGTEVRRLRLSTEGVLAGGTEFRVQLDFAGGSARLKDAYAGVSGLPAVGTLRAGYQYEPFGLEEQTSSKYTAFVERGLTSALNPERNPGLLATNRHGRVFWAAGVFRDADSFGKSTGDGEYVATARLVTTPREGDNGRTLWHLGGAVSVRNPPGGHVEYASGAENHLGPTYVDTGELEADQVVLWGVEAAIVEGPFSIQSELVTASASTGGPDPAFRGFYVFGSYFLTGENRRYKAASAVFDRTKPTRSYGIDGGAGAWEVVTRYSTLDLADASVTGGTLADWSAGVSWYLNPNFRWAANYVRADLDDAGVSHALLTRFQADF